MQKIPSLFKRDYSGDRLVYNDVVPGCEWVLNGEGTPTGKLDGTCCLVQGGVLYKRYDRKLTKKAKKRLKSGGYIPELEDFKEAPEGWQPAEPKPDQHTGHWPGWLLVSPDNPEDKYHWEAWTRRVYEEGTYELLGPKIQGNPYQLQNHRLFKHGGLKIVGPIVLSFEGIREYLRNRHREGIVWHHPDRRMAKIKRSDFGFKWPA